MIGAGLAIAGLAGQVYGAIKGGQANRANQAIVNQAQADNEGFYNRNVNRDFLETNAAKGVFERLRQNVLEQNKQAENTAAVTGATPEAEIAAKSRTQQGYNNAVNQVASQATNYQQGQEAIYRGEKARLTDQQMGINDQKAQNAANLASNAAGLMQPAAALTGFEDVANQPNFWESVQSSPERAMLKSNSANWVNKALGGQ